MAARTEKEASPAATRNVFVITGPSGVGKSTIVRRVLERTGAAYSVSVTTRVPRAGERDGVDYRFVDRAAFEKMVEQDELLEHAEVFGQFYGTPAGPVRQALAAGGRIILDIDVQGGLQVHLKLPGATFVLVLPPSPEVLAARLKGRGTESPAALARRLARARQEIETARQSGVYTYTVVNDNLDDAVARIVEIVNAGA